MGFALPPARLVLHRAPNGASSNQTFADSTGPIQGLLST
jgi:hypothetical protein